MAIINGTATADWIHKIGDGNDPPDGTWNLIATVSEQADTINAGDEDDYVFAAGGNDTVNGGNQLDWLFGQAGDDSLDGGADNDELYGEDGRDTLIGGIGSDDIYGGIGNDSIDGGAGRDIIEGGDGNDTIAGDGDDIITAGADDDIVTLGAFVPLPGGVCTLDGGTGVDTLRFTSGFTPPGGIQTAYFLFTQFASFERLEFNTSAATIALFADFQFGGGLRADATIKGSANADILVFVAAQPSGLSDYSAASFSFVNWTWGADALSLTVNSADTGAHQILGTRFGETIVGAFGGDTLTGNNGNDTLKGAAGNDTLSGGAGTDRLEGGAGDDLYQNPGTDAVIEEAGGGTDEVRSNTTYSLASAANVENLVLTGAAAINGGGNTLANRITGNGAANVLAGGDGNDTLDGGAGADQLKGGNDNDTYLNPDLAGGDTIVEAASGGTADLVQTNRTIDLSATPNVERITLTGAGNIDATGNASANVIAGNAGRNRLDGGAGNDTITGGDGVDTLVGGAGNDTYNNPGADTITEAAGAAGGNADLVQSNASYTLGANIERLTLTGNGNVNGTGNALANIINGNGGQNTLDGGAQNDKLNGGAGKDILIGGAGNDTLNGGSEADTFRFAVAGTGADTINGFEYGLDRFDLAGGTFTAIADDGTSTTLTHAGGTILIAGVSGHSLAQWKAQILPAGGSAAAHGGIGGAESAGFFHDAAGPDVAELLALRLHPADFVWA